MAITLNIVSTATALEIVVTMEEGDKNYLPFTRKSMLKGHISVSTNKDDTAVYLECGKAPILLKTGNTTLNGVTQATNDTLYTNLVTLRDS